MRGLVIVHTGDRKKAEPLLSEGRLTSEIWDIENCDFEACTFHADREGRGVLVDTANREVAVRDIAQRYSAIVLIGGDRAVSDWRLRRLLADFLRGAAPPKWSNETIVVIALTPNARSRLRMLPRQRVFYAPSELTAATTSPFPSEEWSRQVRSDLEGHTQVIDENQTRNPNVGFGLLLVDEDFNTFLMERLRDPGQGRLGTIGGNFERGHTITQELTTVLERRFRSDRGPQVDLGPLLSCSNLKNDFLHYIDLTFLAVVKGGSVDDVVDEELLRPLSPEMLSHLDGSTPDSHSSNSGGERRMFTLPEVAVFYHKNLLFAPVSNAFEALCRTIFTEQLRHGPRHRIYLPSLVDDGRMLQLRLPDNLDGIRDIVADMRRNRNALPFFEGDIS